MKHFALIILLSLTVPSFAQNFTIVDSLPDGAYGNAAWGDFNNDGFKDVAYLTQAVPDPVFKVYSYNGAGFTEVASLPFLFNPGVKWGDLNNDGFDDLVANGLDSALSAITYTYQSNGNGTFTALP